MNDNMIKIKVPATSANLGAGFDSLGLALDLYNYVYIEKSSKTQIISLDDEKVPIDESNLVYRAVKEVYDYCGEKLKEGLTIKQVNNIPMTRGLGSSSACIAAGVLGANILLGNRLNKDELLNIASKMEGHPDNVAPALLGGVVTSVFDRDKVYYVKQEIEADLDFYIIVPDFKVKTDISRANLPKMVKHSDAVFNVSRAALFSASLLKGKYENLKIAADDKLHQPFRFKEQKGCKEVLDECYKFSAYAAYLSGAGPSIIAIAAKNNYFFSLNMKEKLNELGLGSFKIYKHSIDNYGAQGYFNKR